MSWKGSEERSGGVVTNIGIHFFDLLLWLFGRVQLCEVNLRQPHRAAGYFELERASVRWFLSTDRVRPAARIVSRRVETTFRSIQVDGAELEFSEGFVDLHTTVYERVSRARVTESKTRARRLRWRIRFGTRWSRPRPPRHIRVFSRC